jgi:putative phosphoribosyl transferase
MEAGALYRFKSRRFAGLLLAERLLRYQASQEAIVLALPRGGVPIGYEIARVLHLPLDVFQVRKLGVPGHEELAMGAIGSGGGRYLNREVIDSLHISQGEIESVTRRETAELERRERLYRDNRPRRALAGRLAIVVDDGVATGSSMFAAIETLRSERVARIVVAIPVGPIETCESIARTADELTCLQTPEPFYAVGTWYERFEQVSDDEVRDLLADAQSRVAS